MGHHGYVIAELPLEPAHVSEASYRAALVSTHSERANSDANTNGIRSVSHGSQSSGVSRLVVGKAKQSESNNSQEQHVKLQIQAWKGCVR